MSGHGHDWYRTAVMSAVILVAAIAGVVSFLHIRSVSLRYGQPQLAADLMPISVDGLVAICTVTMLRASRLALSAPWTARAGLGLGVVATLAANAVDGLSSGWPGAVVSSWPPVAFLVAVEVAVALTSRKRSQRSPVALAARTDRAAKRTPGRAPRRAPAADTVRAVLASQPGLSTGQLATMTGLSDRTVRRVKADLNGTTG